jgi:hypothetical protein
MPEHHLLSLVQLITLSLSKLSLLQRMASNDNGKHKLEEEVESLTKRKRLRLFDDDSSDDDSSDSLEEEVSSEETSTNQLNTSEEKLFAKCARGSNDGDTTPLSSEPRTPKSCRHFNVESSDDNDDFWM